MALARYQNTAVDEAGNILASPTVQVDIEGGGLASLFSDRAGASPITNPFAGNADGTFAFHVAGGAYKITVTQGVYSRVLRYQAAGTAAEHDAGDFQPADSDLSAIALLTTTAFGRALLELADAAAGRTALALGTAAVATIGTAGDTVPKNNTSNTFSARQYVQITGAGTNLSLYVVDAGATGVMEDTFHNSSSPAANDVLWRRDFYGNNLTPTPTRFAYDSAILIDATAASEDGQRRWGTVIAGALADRMTLGHGLILGAPTGGDKGDGSINAKDVYNDNVALTCMALADEFLKSGKVDLARWDAMMPERVTPENRYRRPVYEDARVTRQRLLETEHGFTIVDEVAVEKRQAVAHLPIFAADGVTGVDMIERPLFEDVVEPEKRERQEHKVARIFAAMIEDGFDPRSPRAYVDRLTATHALPGMPTEAEWQHNAMGTGEMFCRLWLAAEMQALVLKGLVERIEALEARQ